MLVASPAPSQIGAFLARYLDGRLDRSPDLTRHATLPGDRYLICSDGLSGVLDPAVIRDVLLSVKDADEAVTELIRLTLQAGAPDNVTVIVADTPEHAWRAAAGTPSFWGQQLAGRECPLHDKQAQRGTSKSGRAITLLPPQAALT